MNKKRPLPGIVLLAILTVVTTFVWIGFEAYKAFTQEPEQDVPAAVLEPLDPTLDQEVLSGITQRVYLNDDEIGDTVLNNESVPVVEESENEATLVVPEATPVEEASESATLSPTPEATPVEEPI